MTTSELQHPAVTVPPANPGPIRVEIVETTAGFDALQPDWDTLVDRMASSSPFVRWDWMRGWWSVHRRDFGLCIAVARDLAGRPVGIAPLVIGYDQHGGRHHLNQLFFLAGCGAAQGERLDFIVPAGWEALVAPELSRALEILETRWDAVRLNHIPEESPNLPHLLRIAAKAGIGLKVLNRSSCHIIDLPEDMNTFVHSRSGNWRRNLNRNWRHLVKHHAARQGVAGRDAAPMEVFDRMGRLHGLRIAPIHSLFLQPDAWRFHRKLAEKWLWSGRAALTFIETDREISAATLVLMDRGEASLFQLGWDPCFARQSLGLHSVRWSIEHAIDHEARLYDTLPGDARYKAELATRSRCVLDLEAFHPHSANASLFRWLRGLKRRCLPRDPKLPPMLFS